MLIDLTKIRYTDLDYVDVESVPVIRDVQVGKETEVKLPDGTIKRHPLGGHLVQFSDGKVKFLSNREYERLIYG
jgi:hypothetical protein